MSRFVQQMQQNNNVTLASQLMFDDHQILTNVPLCCVRGPLQQHLFLSALQLHRGKQYESELKVKQENTAQTQLHYHTNSYCHGMFSAPTHHNLASSEPGYRDRQEVWCIFKRRNVVQI